MRTLPRYTAEFKADAVASLAKTGRSLPEVARDLGIAITSLRSWYLLAEMAKKKSKKPPLKSASPAVFVEGEAPQDEIKRLERELSSAHKEIEDLKLDRAILKKAAAFFAKESE